MYGIKSTSSVKAAVVTTCLPGWTAVTAVPPVEPEVSVTLYCIPFTKIVAFLSLSILILKWYAVSAATVIGNLLI